MASRSTLALLAGLVLAACNQPFEPTRRGSTLPTRPGFALAATDSAMVLAAGDIAGCSSTYKDKQTAALLDRWPDATVFTVGDNAYPDGSAAQWACYDASWGRAKLRTFFAMGNHDYNTAGATPAFNYANGVGVDSGRAGHRVRGYYAMDLANWRIIVLNSEVALSSGSQQLAWYKAQLAAHPRTCQMTVVHRPLFSSPVQSYPLSPSLTHVWNAFTAARGELVVSGSQHRWERFARQRSDRTPDSTAPRGIVVGTGGAGLGTSAVLAAPNNQSLISAHGVLVLTLRPASYSWQFVTIAGTVADSGTSPCRWSGAAETPPPAVKPPPPPVDTVPPPAPVDTVPPPPVDTTPPPPPPPAPAIGLRVKGERRTDGKVYMTLDWSGAKGASVQVYRNGPVLLTTENDGHYTNSRTYSGPVTYTYNVCESGGAVCSNAASVTFP